MVLPDSSPKLASLSPSCPFVRGVCFPDRSSYEFRSDPDSDECRGVRSPGTLVGRVEAEEVIAVGSVCGSVLECEEDIDWLSGLLLFELRLLGETFRGVRAVF